MHWLQNYPFTRDQKTNLTLFLDQYGVSGLEQALKLYIDVQQEYICKTKNFLSKFRVDDIYYLEIREHTITVHTQHGIYQKYGTLNNELKQLSLCGFMKCNQSCIVSLRKIRAIHNSNITLINNEYLHMSRHYAPKVIMAFSRKTF